MRQEIEELKQQSGTPSKRESTDGIFLTGTGMPGVDQSTELLRYKSENDLLKERVKKLEESLALVDNCLIEARAN